jgi:hypothetical protein
MGKKSEVRSATTMNLSESTNEGDGPMTEAELLTRYCNRLQGMIADSVIRSRTGAELSIYLKSKFAEVEQILKDIHALYQTQTNGKLLPVRKT